VKLSVWHQAVLGQIVFLVGWVALASQFRYGRAYATESSGWWLVAFFLWVAVISGWMITLKCPRCGQSIYRYKLVTRKCRQCGADLTKHFR
jgi:hypothetical protein